MNREECENQILEKLKEIKDIAKQYDKDDNFYLSLVIGDDYLTASNRYYENKKTPINVTLIDGKIRHWGVRFNMTTRYFSDKQERHIAKVTGGKVQSNSGGTKFGGGDVHADKFFIEAKTPTKEKQSFSIKRDWMTKIKEQAFEQGKERWALAFTFDPDKQENFYVISENEFLEYLRYKEEKE